MKRSDQRTLKRLALQLLEIQRQVIELHNAATAPINRLSLSKAAASLASVKDELLGITDREKL